LPLIQVYILHPYTNFEVLGLTVRKIWHTLCVCISQPVTLTFDLKLVCNIACITGYSPANFGDSTTIRFRFMGH